MRIISIAASSNKQFKNVCVLSSFRCGKYKELVQTAIDLGRVLVERKIHPVYGRGHRGLSKLVSQAAYTKKSQVIRVISKALKPLRCLSGSLIGEELDILSMQERISKMLNHVDAFIFLTRDFATLEALIIFAS